MKGALKILVVLLVMLSACKRDPALNSNVKVTVMLQNLYIPWGMAFLPNGDFLFCQRNGKIGLLKSSASNYTVLMQRTGLTMQGEGGLLGLTVDPDFSNNNYLYIYETTTSVNQVVRLKYMNGTLTLDRIILGTIPAGKYHDGGALRFGPDGYLYVGTGDATVSSNAQDTSNLAGKILRIDRDGNAAPGNPFNSPIWTYGNRNVQGFGWDAQGNMIATEHGPTGEFGWHAHDEINWIRPGKNYGWPIAIAGTEMDSLTPPLIESDTVVWAPSTGMFVRGGQFGEWNNMFLYGCLQGQKITRLTMDANGSAVVSKTDMFFQSYGRIRGVIQAPDGSIWFSSSNADSNDPLPLPGDDKIYRLSKN